MYEDRYQFQSELMYDFIKSYEENKGKIDDIIILFGKNKELSADIVILAKINLTLEGIHKITVINGYCFDIGNSQAVEPPKNILDKLDMGEIPSYKTTDGIRYLISNKISIKYTLLFQMDDKDDVQEYCLILVWRKKYKGDKEYEKFSTELPHLIGGICKIFIGNTLLFIEKEWYEKKGNSDFGKLKKLLDEYRYLLPDEIFHHKLVELCDLVLREAIDKGKPPYLLRKILEDYRGIDDQRVRRTFLRAWEWLEWWAEREPTGEKQKMIDELRIIYVGKKIRDPAIEEYLRLMNKSEPQGPLPIPVEEKP